MLGRSEAVDENPRHEVHQTTCLGADAAGIVLLSLEDCFPWWLTDFGLWQGP